jgi:hypothetical protein
VYLPNEYHLITKWRVPGTVDEVSTVMQDLETLCVWWPSVYLNVTELQPPGEGGVGRVVAVRSKGWLPYTLRWQARVTDNRHPFGFTLEASGDFDGRGIWTFEQHGADVAMEFDWRLRVEKPLVRSLSFLLKPAFAANHHWAMARGEESLRLELTRRRSSSDDERRAVPAPPGPTSNAAFVLGAAAAAVALSGVVCLTRRRGRR